MNCDETFNAGICYVTDAYKRVCKFNEGLHAELERKRAENAKLRELAVSMLRSIRCFEVCSDSFRVSSVYEQLMRELGIEVD